MDLFNRTKTLLKSLAGRPLDVVETLMLDHMKVEMKIAQIRMIKDRHRRQQLFDEVKQAILAHTEVEEEFFYPECRKIDHSLITDAVSEHRAIVNRLKLMNRVNDLHFRSKLAKLTAILDRHVYEEETMLFPKVRAAIPFGRRLRMAEQIQKAEGAAAAPVKKQREAA